MPDTGAAGTDLKSELHIDAWAVTKGKGLENNKCIVGYQGLVEEMALDQEIKRRKDADSR